MMSDEEWLDKEFLPVKNQRLAKSRQRAVDFFGQFGIRVRPASAGFFAFLDMKKFLREPTEESELKLFDVFYSKYKLYFAPGSQLFCVNPGWFRVIITVDNDAMTEFERRFKLFINDFHASKLDY